MGSFFVRKTISGGLLLVSFLLWNASCSNEQKKEITVTALRFYQEQEARSISPLTVPPATPTPERTASDPYHTVVAADFPMHREMEQATPEPVRAVETPSEVSVAEADAADFEPLPTKRVTEEMRNQLAQRIIADMRGMIEEPVRFTKEQSIDNHTKRGEIDYYGSRKVLIAMAAPEETQKEVRSTDGGLPVVKRVRQDAPVESRPVTDGKADTAAQSANQSATQAAAPQVPADAPTTPATEPATPNLPVLNKPAQVTEPAPPPAEAVPSGTSVESASPATEKKSGEALITNSFFETDIRQALQDVALAMGQTIVVAPDVQGYVSLELNNVPLEKALTLMLAGTGYIYKKMPEYYLVCTTDPESKTFLDISETQIIKINYVEAESAVKMLPLPLQKYVRASSQSDNRISRREADSYSSSGRSVGMSRIRTPEVSGSSLGMGNMVSITAPPQIMERIVSELQMIDRRPQQILLDARIVVLETSDLLELGADWTWPTISAGSYTGDALKSAWPWGVQIGYTPSKEFTDQLMMTLNLLTQNDEASVIANPQVLAQDGKSAQISVTNEEYFEILTQGYYTQSELEKVEVGTILTITPRVGENDEISMEMSTEVSDVVSRGDNNLPVVTRRTTINTVRVEDGGTAAVAGLVYNRSSIQNKKVPFIGSIPVVGEPFKNEDSSGSSRQVAVFVTPRLISDAYGLQKTPYKKELYKSVGEEFRNELAKKLNLVP